jgi:hypothetical protein
MGEIVAEHIGQSNMLPSVKSELSKIVLQMASIAHHARAHQLQEKLRNGEMNESELPSWALESFAASD